MKNKEKKRREKRKATLLEAISAVFVLMGIFFFGSLADLSAPALMGIAMCYVVWIGWRCGYTWKDLEEFSAEKVKAAAPANSVLIAVGFLLGAWMFSGTIPMFIYYGVQLVSAKWILVSAFILCAIFSICTGTSWGSAATAGITMMSIAMAMPETNIAAVAAACYTGAIFGDKLSPLSDTTILAALATKNDIFDHIKHMSKTVVPAAAIGLIIYGVMGVRNHAADAGLPENTMKLLESLDAVYHWNVIVLIPMVILIYGCITKKPSTVIMMLSAVVAVLIGVFYQGFSLEDGVSTLYNGFNLEMAEGARDGFIAADAGDDAMKLLNRGGLASMMKSFITVYICLYFAAIMEQIGAIEALLGKLLLSVKTRFSLILVTSISCVLLVAIGGSSTLALLLTGEMYAEKYKEMGLSTLNLSRTMEDFCTGMAGFIPWSASGIYYPSVLGVSIAQYFPYCFMSYSVWVLAYVYSITGICMKPLETEEQNA
ncbi:Na+/H+ antiporter NhaC [Emergencia sp. JLR.KK010]|uniref:Na+/H+ antiporter NhaC n=1 Tax=Emergencia sp. JLR.KK010 TaxID=3114296 RepID=UPI0030CDB9DA